MCVIQYYRRWQCGCTIDREEDQALISICLERVNGHSDKCSIYIVPAYDQERPVSVDESSANSINGSNRSDCDSDVTCFDGDAYMSRFEPPAYEKRTRGIDMADEDEEAETEETEKEQGNEDFDSESEWESIGDFDVKKAQLKSSIRAHGLKDTGGQGEDSDETEYDEDDGIPDRYCVKQNMRPRAERQSPDEIAAYEAEIANKFLTSPRMCQEHEEKFERIARGYFASEVLWLRPKMLRRGQQAYEHLEFTMKCAKRLWDLYLSWKYFHGGDQEAAALVTSDDFCPPHDERTADTDGCETLAKVLELGDVDYNALQWGVENLLVPLRNVLHPREMAEL